MRGFGIVLAFAWSMAMSPVSAGEPVLRYEIKVVSKPDPHLLVEVDLTALDQEETRRAFSRARRLGIPDQTAAASCDGIHLRRIDKGRYQIPAACSILSWTSRFDSMTDKGIVVNQQSIVSADRRFGMISGPASLLRVTGEHRSQYKLFASDGTLAQEGTLPPLSRPPFFLPYGDWTVSTTKERGFELTYFLDDAAYLGGAGEWPEHSAGLSYFSDLLGPEQPIGSYTVVWFGHDFSEGGLNGAAGDRVLIVNYPRSNDEMSDTERVRALYVLLHEQFHQIDTHAPVRGRAATWRGESVATYFALKALRRARGFDAPVQDVWAAFIDPDRPVTRSLLDVERRMMSGDRSDYGLFYTQGATFWYLLDRIISDASGGAEAIDVYLPRIQAIGIVQGGGFPKAAIDLFPKSTRTSIETLAAKYIGRPAD